MRRVCKATLSSTMTLTCTALATVVDAGVLVVHEKEAAVHSDRNARTTKKIFSNYSTHRRASRVVRTLPSIAIAAFGLRWASGLSWAWFFVV